MPNKYVSLCNVITATSEDIDQTRAKCVVSTKISTRRECAENECDGKNRHKNTIVYAIKYRIYTDLHTLDRLEKLKKERTCVR